jgi:hypothetical protein
MFVGMNPTKNWVERKNDKNAMVHKQYKMIKIWATRTTLKTEGEFWLSNTTGGSSGGGTANHSNQE